MKTRKRPSYFVLDGSVAMGREWIRDGIPQKGLGVLLHGDSALLSSCQESCFHLGIEFNLNRHRWVASSDSLP